MQSVQMKSIPFEIAFSSLPGFSPQCIFIMLIVLFIDTIDKHTIYVDPGTCSGPVGSGERTTF